MVSEVVQYYITGCKRTMKAQVDGASSGPNTPTRVLVTPPACSAHHIGLISACTTHPPVVQHLGRF